MIPFKVKITRLRPPEMMLREWNRVQKQAMLEAGHFWIKEFLPLHFEPGAVQRYGYTARAEKYNRIKRKADTIRVKGVTLPAPKPAAPLVWSGEMKEQVLSRSPESFNIRTTATSKKAQAKIPIRLPHPLNPRNAGELTRLTNAELRAMNKVAFEAVKRLLAELSQPSTTEIGG